MFGDDENDDFLDSSLKEHVEKFETYLKSGFFSFFDSDVVELLVDHYLVIGDNTKAIKAAEYGMEYYPANKLFDLRIAQAYSAKGLLQEALNMLTNKESFREHLVEFYLTKASIFSQLKNSDNAIKFFKMALELTEREEHDEIYLDIAMEYQYKGDYSSAIDILETALKSNPRNEIALYELAFCYDFIGEFDKAISCYMNFIDENPYSFTAWYNLGNIYSKVEDWDNALKAYDFSNAINEEFTPVYFNMGNAYLALDEYDNAAACFKKCLSLEGDDAYAYCYLGECYEQQDYLKDARYCYNKALELDPLLADAWLGIGIVNDLEGDTKTGIAYIQKAIEIDPSNASYLHVIASAYEKIELYEDAHLYYEKTLNLFPQNPDAVKDYYIMLTNLNLWREANTLLDNFTQYGENTFTVDLLRAHWLWNNMLHEPALHVLGQCIAQNEHKAKELLEWFEKLKKEPQIINLFENL